MNRDRIMENYDKACRVIDSCLTREQFDIADRYVKLFYHNHKDHSLDDFAFYMWKDLQDRITDVIRERRSGVN